MAFDEFGTLSISASIAGGAIPIEGAIVRIRGASEENRFINYSVLTDRDGVSGKITLPAPSSVYSLTPTPSEIPYGLYDVEITAPEFLKKQIYNVAVFAGINTNLPINMIPSSVHKNNAPTPEGTLNTVIPESTLS